MATTWALVGNVAGTTATVTGEVVGASVRVATSTHADMSSPVYAAAQVPDGNGFIRRNLIGLAAGARHYVALEVDGVLDTAWINAFKTDTAPAGEPMSFKVAWFSCAPGSGNPVSDHLVHSRIADHQADVLLHLGDFGYPNIATADPALYRAAWRSQISGTAPKVAWKSGAFYYTWDDHDYGPDDSDGTSVSKTAAAQVYREMFPHAPLVESSAIYHSFVKGRLRFIVTDERYYRDPYTDTDDATKTMLGAAQLAWFFNEISEATAEGQVPVWCSSQVPHLGDATYPNWGSYTNERKVIWNWLADNEITDLVVLAGDVHSLGYKIAADYSDSQTAPIRCYTSSGLDALPGGSFGVNAGWDAIYTTTVNRAGIYATLDVIDDGLRITFTFRGWQVVRSTGEQTLQMSDTWTVGRVPGFYSVVTPEGYPRWVHNKNGLKRYVAFD